MKTILLLLCASLTLTSCYKEDLTMKAVNSTSSPSNTGSSGGSGNAATSHDCGYPTRKGPCKRRVSDTYVYCWQHR